MSANRLTAPQWAMLSGTLQLTDAAQRTGQDSCPSRRVLDPDYCRWLLETLTPPLLSPSIKITASLLAKRIGFLTTAASLYAMSVYNKGLNMTLDNSVLEFGHARLWTSTMPLYDLTVSQPELGQRDAWRDSLFDTLFAQHLSPILHTLSTVSGAPLRILWENVAVRVFSLYEQRIEWDDPAAECSPGMTLAQQVQQDFDALLAAPGERFGCDDNPLKPFFRAKTRVPVAGRSVSFRDVRFRRTCCFYYKASQPQEYCQNCPLLRPTRKTG
ncbi:(2Fe-2S)-binding protein [Pectobacterium brasiliense]|uniref:IucA/IucC family C-terminal-domain containing protein n=1 Tax=Pectobacterium brasiliense TaxID=180957 RepID=UPI001968F356|nr:IucA/IucC family C-terminal-domain containing protein [Pectobacterium brasiliense]QSD34261.1 (2Fe-2S)-binding protein [Pectobacterium brasiliense]